MTTTTGLHYALRAAHAAENALVGRLDDVASRHSDEAEAYHVSRDLLMWSRRHIGRLAAAADARGLDLHSEPWGPGSLVHASDGARRVTGSAAPTQSAALLEDIRAVYLAAAETSTAWEMLAQYAQAARDADLLSVVSRCHPETLRQMRWANTMLKTLSPQVLTSM
jgi:ferritin-like metal-binding protein YciE